METQATPGLQRRKRSGGRVAIYWIARDDLVKLGYQPKSVNLTDLIGFDSKIAIECQRLQIDMLRWADEHRQGKVAYNGTIRSLIQWYLTDEHSPYRDLAPKTARNYDQVLAKLNASVGDLLVEDISGADVRGWYRELCAQASVGYSYQIINTFKAVLAFGASHNRAECLRLRAALQATKFEAPEPRRSRLTYQQLVAFRETARQLGRPSMALGLTLQFECAMRHSDVRALKGADIDAQGVLHKRTSKTGAEASHRISDYPELAAMLSQRLAQDRLGQLVVNEHTKSPYSASQYAETYRRIARKANIPDEVWAMDARAGAVTETYEAGGTKEEAKALATHQSDAVSLRYSRENLERSSQAARKRVAARAGGRP
jgi:integrase